MINLYVYGTLRPGIEENTAFGKGVMYIINGNFPGVVLGGCGFFRYEKIEVPDNKLQALDWYEGYNPDDLSSSLFVRKPFLDGFIYEYNNLRKVEHLIIKHGDWLKFKNQKVGTYGTYFL